MEIYFKIICKILRHFLERKSTSNRKEYQEYLMVVKTDGA